MTGSPRRSQATAPPASAARRRLADLLLGAALIVPFSTPLAQQSTRVYRIGVLEAVNYPELYARLARYADAILKGKQPADLPVEQPTRFELVVNMNAARGLDVKVPQAVLLRADALVGN